MSDIDALQSVDQIYRSSYEAVVYVGREEEYLNANWTWNRACEVLE